ncbi:hypothetical protein [uncultured Megasphaera sp.]|uniref:hypothetical protein n=1 Tax=uncultured Megasphaera sp. TaxID=165188 RepID=UPI0025D4CD66|nr:hypothetical protein [uncultured Megasphaera sp.]
MIKKIRHYYGSSYITLAGELNLASESRGRLFTLTPELKQTVNQMISILQEDFPFIRHDIQEGIMETTISLFAYRSACADSLFLNHLKQWLINLARVLYAHHCIVTIHCNGTIIRDGIARDFCLLNKGEEIQYKITAERAVTFVQRVLFSPLWRGSLTIILLIVLVWLLYEHWNPQPAGQLF